MSYNYETDWRKYSHNDGFEKRFLSTEELGEICDVVKINSLNRDYDFGGGIPVHYDSKTNTIYCLKEKPHVRVAGDSGSGKSRKVCRGKAIASILSGNSFFLTDPKGEISSDPKIQYILKEQNYHVEVLDFKTFRGSGFNPFASIYNEYVSGNEAKALADIDTFTNSLENANNPDDVFFDRKGAELINSAAKMLLSACSQRKLSGAYNLASLITFLQPTHDKLKQLVEPLLDNVKGNYLSPVNKYASIANMSAEKTFDCIIASALALLHDFTVSEDLIKMLSVSNGFNTTDLYKRKSAVFLVIPDYVSTYDRACGHLIDIFYQSLVAEFDTVYQNKMSPPCSVDFICDECANVYIPDMAAKISASRSRMIDWTLIYQSDKQMKIAYRDSIDTIVGNCKSFLFLGSNDNEILVNVSKQTGTKTTSVGSEAPLVSVDELRSIKHGREYTDALLLTGNKVACLKLPDYDQYKFLKNNGFKPWQDKITGQEISIYSIEHLYCDVKMDRVDLNWHPRGPIPPKMLF